MEQALSLAQATEFVSKLPDGIHAPITEGGSNVSGGQKQRLSIARALARKPEILIFDDSFSALDYKTDAMLRKGLSEQLKGTTCMIVAQRIGTIKNADNIVVLNSGRIEAEGSQQELLERCPLYRDMWQAHIGAKNWAVSAVEKEA